MEKGHRICCSWCGVTIGYGDASSHGICVACAERLLGSSRLSSERLGALPYGIVGLDSEGIVRAYSGADAVLDGRARDTVVGRSFFWDIAPCARVREFWGAFLALCAGEDHEPLAFDFTFEFRSRPAHVRIRMFRAREEPPGAFSDVEVWVLVDAVAE